jgi:hypothetical protein
MESRHPRAGEVSTQAAKPGPGTENPLICRGFTSSYAKFSGFSTPVRFASGRNYGAWPYDDPHSQILAMNAEGANMWIEAIVMPRENDSRPYRPAPRRDRRAVYTAGCSESLEFRAAVLNYLQAHKLMHAVKWVSEPGSLPMVTLRCQERVLDQLRRAPDFEAGQSLSLALHS